MEKKDGADISRKVSSRRQEKAPEGRAPHGRLDEGEGVDTTDEEGSVLPGGFQSKTSRVTPTEPVPVVRVATPPINQTPRVSVWSEAGPAPTEVDVDEVETVPGDVNSEGRRSGSAVGSVDLRRGDEVKPVPESASPKASPISDTSKGKDIGSPKGRHQGVFSKFKEIISS